MYNNTQLSSFENFDVNNVIFSKPELGNIPGQKISFKRIKVGVRNNDGTIGDLILATPPNLLSFGLQENRDLATGSLNGYVFPICLWSRSGVTESEKSFTNVFSAIIDRFKTYLLENKESIEKYDLDMSDLKKLNPLYWKMEKGKILEDRGPMLYVKTMMSKKTNTVSTIFINEVTNEEMDPMDLLNKHCHVTAAIKFESLFIGNKISVQVKLYETVVRLVDNTIRGLLRPNALPRKTVTSNNQEDSVNSFSVPVNRFSVLKDEDDDLIPEEDEEELGEDEEYEEDDEILVDRAAVATTTPTPTTPPPSLDSVVEAPSAPKKTSGRGGSKVSSSKKKL